MTQTACCEHRIAFAVTSFPRTLAHALSLAKRITPINKNDEVRFKWTEKRELLIDGGESSFETNVVSRWGMRLVNGMWVLEMALVSGDEPRQELPLLIEQFKAYLADPRHAGNELHLVSAADRPMYYGFEYLTYGVDILVAYLPPEIQAECRDLAQKLGFRLQD